MIIIGKVFVVIFMIYGLMLVFFMYGKGVMFLLFGGYECCYNEEEVIE